MRWRRGVMRKRRRSVKRRWRAAGIKPALKGKATITIEADMYYCEHRHQTLISINPRLVMTYGLKQKQNNIKIYRKKQKKGMKCDFNFTITQ